ncbi:LacI family DNA-binding transcriptional regulator [Cohaesibacter intestini]|uniref:LacI family DNA-binding transcriptional regulator n=1 Tax=Cohaesibacter intestini TaxID=2211145 RepID=UPI0018E51EFB|nr:LacI family DNA-binding transcriptional regulator [Cohaesibacter intestini]
MARVTLSDVAKAAGVSKMTASRALREHSDVAAGTRNKVRKIAAEMGYIPNQMASMLSAKSVPIIPMIIPSISNNVYADIVAHAQPVLHGAGYQMMLINTDYSLEREEQAIEALMAWSPSALIVSGIEHTDRARGLLQRAGVPIVEMMDLPDSPIDLSVGFDHVKAGNEMANYLLNRGYQRFCFCGCQLQMDKRAYKRFEGFRNVLLAKGAEEPMLIDIDKNDDILSDADFDRLISVDPAPDCIYFSNDNLAVSALLMGAKRGLSVPDDLAIAGFNDISIGRQTMPQLTTTQSPLGRIGELAARYALDAIAEKKISPRSLDLGFKLLPRESA